MIFECSRNIFPSEFMTSVGNFLFSTDSLSEKLRLRDFVFSDNPMNKNVGLSLLKQFWTSDIPKTYTRCTGHRPLLVLHICTIRYQKINKTSNYVPWHLDANFFGFDVPFWTVWAPFVETGLTAPGLEFCLPAPGMTTVRDSVIRTFWETVKPNNRGQIVIESARIPEFFGNRHFEIVNHLLYPGDAFIFDQFTLHRTQFVPDANKERIAIEYRITSADRLPNVADIENKLDFFVAYCREDGRIVVQKIKEYFNLTSAVSERR